MNINEIPEDKLKEVADEMLLAIDEQQAHKALIELGEMMRSANIEELAELEKLVRTIERRKLPEVRTELKNRVWTEADVVKLVEGAYAEMPEAKDGPLVLDDLLPEHWYTFATYAPGEVSNLDLLRKKLLEGFVPIGIFLNTIDEHCSVFLFPQPALSREHLEALASLMHDVNESLREDERIN